MARSAALVSSLLRASSSRTFAAPVCVHSRSLAVPSSSKSASFSKTLSEGPSLDDFIAGEAPERVILGNTSQYVLACYDTGEILIGVTSPADRGCRRS